MTTQPPTVVMSRTSSTDVSDYPFQKPHFLSVHDLNEATARSLINRASDYANAIRDNVPIEPTLVGKHVVNLFFENSTRTLASFDMATQRLGGRVTNLPMETSSVKKGESLVDTLKTIDAMRPDVIVIRHGSAGAADIAAKTVDAHVINAGDGAREHPTQALLDAVTVTRTFGDVSGLTITICGDIKHSRVARSNIALLSMLGADVRLCAPPTLLPDDIRDQGLGVFTNLADALPGSDVIMALRVQTERMDHSVIPSTREYHQQYGLTLDRLAVLAPKAKIMHPGPMNRGVEIDGNVADHPTKSLILDQVENGVAARMAVLHALISQDGHQT